MRRVAAFQEQGYKATQICSLGAGPCCSVVLCDWLSPCVFLSGNLGHLLQLPTIAQPIENIFHSVFGFDPCQFSSDLIGNFIIILEILQNKLLR